MFSNGKNAIRAEARARLYVSTTPRNGTPSCELPALPQQFGELPREFKTKNKQVSPVHSNAFLRKLGLPTDRRDREILAARTVSALQQCEFGLTDRDLVVIGLCVHGNKHRHIA